MPARPSRWAVATLALLTLAFTGAGPPSAAPPGLDIYFIDVLGGAATLIVTPERESILIDSGWPKLEDRDPKRIVHVLKHVVGLDHLDHVITTHWHTDHYGGIEGLSRMVRIDHFWDRGLPDLTKPNQDAAEFPDGPKSDDPLGIAYRKASQGKRKSLKAGDTLPLKGQIKTFVIASGGKIIDEKDSPGGVAGVKNKACEHGPPDTEPDRTDNGRSLAFVFRLGSFDFLDCGDLTWMMEKSLVCPINLIGQIDLYQVTHHGMGISNHPTLVESIAPTVSVMNNGPKKGGSPSTVVLLDKTPSIKAAYQLHRNIETAPEENADPEMIANKDAAGGQFIQVNVAPDGSKFSVRIGPYGPPKTFASK
jgi:beta-lactamase superfamily II metal-dependent hydrolase